MSCETEDRGNEKGSGNDSTFFVSATHMPVPMCEMDRKWGVNGYNHAVNGLERETEGESKGNFSLVNL